MSIQLCKTKEECNKNVFDYVKEFHHKHADKKKYDLSILNKKAPYWG